MSRSVCLTVALVCTLSRSGHADVLSVGPNGSYAAPCEAFAAAADGDTIEIDSAGVYDGDVCPISKNNLTIRGTPGLAKIDAAGMNSGGKGTWVVQGDDTTVENIEFSGAAVPDLNGAGIRQEGRSLTVRGCYFHDNEDGILGGDGADSEILIENSEFFANGAGDGYSHNLYIGHAGKLTFRYNYSHGSLIGHLLKSRAAENYVLYNRISGEDSTSSYELNFPNGGKTYIIGNLIEQGPDTDNSTILAYIEEGTNAANPSHQLYVVNNTFVNSRGNGTFVNIAAEGDPVVITNNVFFGGGSVTNQAGAVLSHNSEAEPCLVNAAAFDYHLVAGSPCVDGGEAPGDGDGFALLPSAHYVHPHDSTGRSSVGTIDIGAYELGGDAAPEGGEGNGTAGTVNGQGGSAGKPSGGGAATGGTGSSSAGSASNAGGDAVTSAKAADESGCGCRVGGSGAAWGSVLLGLTLAGAALRRRQHRYLQ